MRSQLFLIAIVLFCAISYAVGYGTIEGFSRSGDYRGDMFGSNQCPCDGCCRVPTFDNSNQMYLL